MLNASMEFQANRSCSSLDQCSYKKTPEKKHPHNVKFIAWAQECPHCVHKQVPQHPPAHLIIDMWLLSWGWGEGGEKQGRPKRGWNEILVPSEGGTMAPK